MHIYKLSMDTLISISIVFDTNYENSQWGEYTNSFRFSRNLNKNLLKKYSRVQNLQWISTKFL